MLDTLTGLPNRRCMTDELNRVIAHCRRTQEWVLVGFIDLDHFKQINDRYGHEAGDALMRTMAEQLGSAMRSSDILARFGGDEFVMVGIGPPLQSDGDAVVRTSSSVCPRPLCWSSSCWTAARSVMAAPVSAWSALFPMTPTSMTPCRKPMHPCTESRLRGREISVGVMVLHLAAKSVCQ